MSQHFQERDEARARRQVLAQERLCQPIVLTLHGLPSQRFERGPRAHEAAQSQMKRGKQPTCFSIEGIERKEIFERRRGPAILAGVHLCNGVLEQRRLFVVADAALLLGLWRNFLVGFKRRFFIESHGVTL